MRHVDSYLVRPAGEYLDFHQGGADGVDLPFSQVL
jgi:hypothetical protein